MVGGAPGPVRSPRTRTSVPLSRPEARPTDPARPGRSPAWSADMSTGRIAELLHEAAETHHRVYRMTDGEDADWASWYASWLIELSELPDVLGRPPGRGQLFYLLVLLDKEYTGKQPGERWEEYYARRVKEH